MATRHDVAGEGLYTATKGGLNSITRVVSKELSAFNITCNVVAPSVVDTDMIKNINKKKLQEILLRNAIHNFDELENIANIINFLISEEAGSVTGQVIYSGGV